MIVYHKKVYIMLQSSCLISIWWALGIHYWYFVMNRNHPKRKMFDIYDRWFECGKASSWSNSYHLQFVKILCDILQFSRCITFSPGPTWSNIFLWLFTKEINSAIANNLKPIGMIKHNVWLSIRLYLRIRFRLFEDSSRPFLNILPTLCEITEH